MSIKRGLSFIGIAVCLAILGGWAGAGVGEEIDPFDRPWDDRSAFAGGLVAAERYVLDGLPGASVYRIQIEIADDYLSYRGELRVLYTNREADDLSDVVFRLFPNAAGGTCTVSEVTIDGDRAVPTFEGNDTVMRVPLAHPLAPEESVEIGLAFDVALPTEFVGWGPFGYVERILSLDTFYPMIPARTDAGWSIDEIPPRGDWTHLDASFYLVRVTAPSALVLAASGVEIDRRQASDVQTVTYALGPARDFFLAGSEDYETYSDTWEEVEITHFFFPGGESQARLATVYTERMLETYSSIIGPYPYTEFDIATTFMDNGSAMEYPGIVAETIDIYDRSVVYFGVVPSKTMLEVGIAHEGAHQWFYNVVGNDQINEPWIDEALAQYCSFLYYDERASYMGRNYKRDWWDRKWERVDRADIPIGMPCRGYSAEEYGPIVYGRGPYFFDALAEAFGVPRLDEFLKAFYEDHKWSVATTESLRASAERFCDCDLTELFESWVYPTEEPPVDDCL